MRLSVLAILAPITFALVACDKGSSRTITSENEAPAASASPTPIASAAPSTPAPSTPAEGALRLGAPIEASAQKVALSDVAKRPTEFTGKTFATTGTVTAVCQHQGCWMELTDDASKAHVKMAGHAFYVPKTASGRQARVLARLEKVEAAHEKGGACEGPHHEGMAATGHGEAKGCRAEAEEQLGRPLAKLELVAEGVELM